ncbi:MAG TPA: thioredoxin domain-containing protein [Nocardioides sp.]|nr:thioredoxin domain-containing protein [Nocardioides sp.]
MTPNNDKAAARSQKAAALRAEQERQEHRRRLLMIGGVAAVLVLLVGGLIAFSVMQQDKKEKHLEAAASTRSDYGVVIGPDSAAHKLVVYEDFLCPFCGELEKQTHAELAQLADAGKVQVEYRPFNLLGADADSYSVRSANAFAVVLDSSGADVAKKLHDLLYAHQPPESDPDSVTDDDLVDLAVQAGAKDDQVRSGIQGMDQVSWVEGATREAQQAGVNSTPTLVLDGEKFEDGRTIDELADNLLGAVQ